MRLQKIKNNLLLCLIGVGFLSLLIIPINTCAKKTITYYMTTGEVKKIPVSFSDSNYYYHSTNLKVLEFTDSGKMKALKSGNATVVLTHFDSNNEKEVKRFKVRIHDKVKKLKWKKKINILNIGDEDKYSISYKVASKKNIEFQWSSSNPKVAQVDHKGHVKALSFGTTKISCEVMGEKKIAISTRLKVVSVPLNASEPECIPVSRIDVTQNKITIKLNSSYNLEKNVTVYPDNATNKMLSISSQDESVVKYKSGLLYAVGIGHTTVKIEATGGSECMQFVDVSVTDWIGKDDTHFIAHRGLSAEAPENTLKAFEMAWEKGFYAIETDVWLSKDGKFIISHDNNIQRICGVDKKISELRYDEICKIPIKGGSNYQNYANDKMATTIPTLKQYLNICKIYNMVPMIEVKFSEGNSELNDSNVLFRLYNEINEMMGDKSVSVISFNQSVIKNMNEIIKKKQAQNIKLFLLGGNYKNVSDIPDYRYYVDNNIGFSIEQHIDENVIRKMVADGAEVCLWTVDETDNVKTYIDWGVTYIVTNKVLWKQ